MRPSEEYRLALELSVQHEEFISECTLPALAVAWLAASLSGRLEVIGRDIAFSWLRCDGTPSYPPEEKQWKSNTGKLWIGDVVAAKGTSGVRVGKSLRKELVNRGIATEGEKVYFFRQSMKRFGSIIARGGI